jgi:hypothetical protein
VSPSGRLAIALAAALGSAAAPQPVRAPAGVARTAAPPRDAFAEGKHRGICYAHAMRPGRGYGSGDSDASLRALAGMGVRWISITPFGFQRTSDATEIRWGGQRIAESDERLRAVTAQARALGLKVMLKPHIWLRPPAWPGTINHATDAAWAQWFAAYRPFILHYAALARDAGMDAFCIGNELQYASLRDREWRDVIAGVRGAYPGPITYGATAEEVTGVPFWDAVDFIGVSAYFPLVADRTPSRDALAGAWRPVSERLRALSARHGKRVVFTEIGYRSADFGAWRHWEIQDDAAVNMQAQANAYAAFFESVWGEEWMGGAYFWKWFSHPGHSGPGDNDFEFEGKPAAVIVSAAYRAAAAGRDVKAAVRGAAAAAPSPSRSPSGR